MSKQSDPLKWVNMQVSPVTHEKFKSISKGGYTSIKCSSLAGALALEKLDAEEKARILNEARTLLMKEDQGQ